MKTKYFSATKSTLIYATIAFISIAMVSCGSYVSRSYYDRDGIYGSNQTTETPPAPNYSEQNNTYKNYFGSLQRNNNPEETFTDVESYSTTNDTVINSYSDNYNSYPSWGGNPTSSTINYYNNNWGWNLYGSNWMYGWGWNSWYGPNYGWGWNNWYNPYYGYGWHTPNYNYYNGYGPYNNYTYNPSRRGAHYNINTNRYGDRYLENRTDFNRNRKPVYNSGRVENTTTRTLNSDYNSNLRNRPNQRTEYNNRNNDTRDYTSPTRNTVPSRTENTNSTRPSSITNDNYTPRSYSPSPAGGSGGGTYGGGRSGGGGRR